MNMPVVHDWRRKLAAGHTVTWLKTAIIAVALIVIILALTTNNKWLLAGLLLYEVLP